MQQSYQDRLSALRRALATALSDAQHTVARGYCDTPEEGAELAFVNLWDATVTAIIDHTDAEPCEVLSMIAGTMEMRGTVPLLGTVVDGTVRWGQP